MKESEIEAWGNRHQDWQRKTTESINVWINEGSRLFRDAGFSPLDARRKAVDYIVDLAHTRFKAQRRAERRAERERRKSGS